MWTVQESREQQRIFAKMDPGLGMWSLEIKVQAILKDIPNVTNLLIG